MAVPKGDSSVTLGPTLWRVKTRLGYYVRTTPGLLTRKLEDHPDLRHAGNLKAQVGHCLRRPIEVRESKTEKATHLYYLPLVGKFLCIKVLHQGDQSFIKTLHWTRKIEGSVILYKG